MHIAMDEPETGHIEEDIEANTPDGMESFTVGLTPAGIMGALEALSDQRVNIAFGPSDRGTLCITGTDFRCDVMPRVGAVVNTAKAAA